MSGMWNRTLVYLGLREEPDETYDDLPERFVPEHDPHAEHAPPRPSAMARGREPVADPGLVPDPTEPVGANGNGHDNVLSLRTGDVHVRAVSGASSSRAALVEVARFDDVEAVGARYRTGQAVVFDASAADAATARRIVDFVSGLTYALRGEMTKVGTRAFLVVPNGVALSAAERQRLADQGYRLPVGSEA